MRPLAMKIIDVAPLVSTVRRRSDEGASIAFEEVEARGIADTLSSVPGEQATRQPASLPPQPPHILPRSEIHRVSAVAQEDEGWREVCSRRSRRRQPHLLLKYQPNLEPFRGRCFNCLFMDHRRRFC